MTMHGSQWPQQEYREGPVLHQDHRQPQCKTPQVQVLHTIVWQVRLLDGLMRQRKLITDDMQHALGKVQMVMTTFWSVSKHRYLAGEPGCSLKDSARGYQHSK